MIKRVYLHEYVLDDLRDCGTVDDTVDLLLRFVKENDFDQDYFTDAPEIDEDCTRAAINIQEAELLEWEYYNRRAMLYWFSNNNVRHSNEWYAFKLENGYDENGRKIPPEMKDMSVEDRDLWMNLYTAIDNLIIMHPEMNLDAMNNVAHRLWRKYYELQ